jgi:hypothetical protein
LRSPFPVDSYVWIILLYVVIAICAIVALFSHPEIIIYIRSGDAGASSLIGGRSIL